jgi:hypothetical protein
MGILDLLARAQLEALRRADWLIFSGGPEALRDLVDFAGLGDVLPIEPPSDAPPAEPRDQDLDSS